METKQFLFLPRGWISHVRYLLSDAVAMWSRPSPSLQHLPNVNKATAGVFTGPLRLFSPSSTVHVSPLCVMRAKFNWPPSQPRQCLQSLSRQHNANKSILAKKKEASFWSVFFFFFKFYRSKHSSQILQHQRVAFDPPSPHPRPCHLKKKGIAANAACWTDSTPANFSTRVRQYGDAHFPVLVAWHVAPAYVVLARCLLRRPIGKVDRNILTFSHPDRVWWRWRVQSGGQSGSICRL